MLKFLAAVSLLAITLSSCSSSEKEPEEKSNGLADKAETSMEERRSRGDTLALSPDVLYKALPETVLGFSKKGDAEKIEDKTTGSNWSSVSQNYSNGNFNLTVKISDYNGAYGLYAGATALFNSTTGTGSEEGISRPFREGKIKGWETYTKENKEASLMLARHDRFIISLEADGQEDLEFVKNFAKEIDLSLIPH